MFVSSYLYVQIVHWNTGYHRGNQHIIGHWSSMPLDLKILLPLVVVWHFAALAPFFRLAIVWGEIGPRDEIGE